MESKKMFQDVLESRFSCRSFEPKKISLEELNYILEMSRLAPTAKNKQPQRIVVVENEGLLERLKEATPFTFDAKTVLVVSYDKDSCWIRKNDSKSYGEVDATIAITHILLAATSIDIGSVFVGVFDEQKVKDILDLPQNYGVVGIVPLGYPKEIKPHNTRLDLEELVIYK
jgi:nitroreductase